jgi:hypothetical protein
MISDSRESEEDQMNHTSRGQESCEPNRLRYESPDGVETGSNEYHSRQNAQPVQE